MDNIIESDKKEFQKFAQDFADSCIEFEMSKDGVFKLVDMMCDLLEEKIRKKGKSYPDFFNTTRDNIKNELNGKTFASGEYDEFLLKMFKKIFTEKMK